VFKIVSEGSVASGVRRVEAVTAEGALEHIASQEEALLEAARRLEVGPWEVPGQLDKLMRTVKELEREVTRLKARLAGAFVDGLAAQADEVDGIKIVTAGVDGLDRDGLRSLGDRLKERLGESVVVLASAAGGSVQMVAMATPGAVARGVSAREVVRNAATIVGGGGGGSERMAQAGGKDPSRLEEALRAAKAGILQHLEGEKARQV